MLEHTVMSENMYEGVVETSRKINRAYNNPVSHISKMIG